MWKPPTWQHAAGEPRLCQECAKLSSRQIWRLCSLPAHVCLSCRLSALCRFVEVWVIRPIPHDLFYTVNEDRQGLYLWLIRHHFPQKDIAAVLGSKLDELTTESWARCESLDILLQLKSQFCRWHAWTLVWIFRLCSKHLRLRRRGSEITAYYSE